MSTIIRKDAKHFIENERAFRLGELPTESSHPKTATMACMGRVVENWMVCVETSNKKLIDRGTRLIAELTGLSYDEACNVLHETMEEVGPQDNQAKDAPSPVALAVQRIGLKHYIGFGSRSVMRMEVSFDK